MKTRKQSLDKRYARLVRMLTKNPKVIQPEGKKGFGSSGLYGGGKLFAFLSYKKRLVVKVPAARVNELVARGEGTHWNPTGSRFLREWLVLKPASRMKWLPLARQAMEFATPSKGRDQCTFAS